MPLVSGVCRAASAPMLSHGGSRLNASKPEANPKTSCPKNTKISLKKKQRGPTSLLFFFQSCQNAFFAKKDQNPFFQNPKLLKIESPLKEVRSSDLLDGPKYTKNSREF